MFKKVFQFLLGEPMGYVSPADKFLAKVRKDNPTPSASQVAEMANFEDIATRRDGHAPKASNTELWRDF
jgi:hypothetical protein